MLQKLHQDPKQPCQFWQLFTHACTQAKDLKQAFGFISLGFPKPSLCFLSSCKLSFGQPKERKDQQPQCGSTLWGRGKEKEREATSIGFQPQACQFQPWHAAQLTHSEVVIDVGWAPSGPRSRKESNPAPSIGLPGHLSIRKGTLHLHLAFFFVRIILKFWKFLRTVEGLLVEWNFCLVCSQIRYLNVFLLFYVFPSLFLLF